MKAFANYHPAVLLLYFLSVLLVGMFVTNPVLQLTMLLGAVLFYLMLPHRSGGAGFYVPMFLLVAVTNPLFSHNGVTPLFYLNGNPVTLEAFVYGAAIAVMVVQAPDGLVLQQPHGTVVHIVVPDGADYSVCRRHGARREGCKRDRGGGLLAVIPALRVADPIVGQTAEAPLPEIGHVTVEVVGPHRADDDLHDKTGRFGGLCAAAEGEEE